MAPTPRAGLSFRTSPHIDPTIAALSGDLDLSTGPDIATALMAATHPGMHLILDLSGLRFCDCAGLGALQRVANHCRAQGGRLSLAAPTGIVARLLQYASGSMTVTTFASITDALVSINHAGLERASSIHV